MTTLHFAESLRELVGGVDVVLSDIWGVVHNGLESFPEACEALHTYRSRGGTVILITNAPLRLLTLVEALVLARVRWQIELIFKLWKSHGQIDTWRTARAERILCEVYAKLLAMVLQQWMLIVGCWEYADRSLTKAAQVIRDHAIELASARARGERLCDVLETIQRVLRRTARMNPRAKDPHTYQLLLALTTVDEQA